jgi:hypothetical protein
MLIDVFLTSPFVRTAPLYPDGTKWERNLPVSPISTAYVMSRAILLYKTLLMQSYLCAYVCNIQPPMFSAAEKEAATSAH